MTTWCISEIPSCRSCTCHSLTELMWCGWCTDTDYCPPTWPHPLITSSPLPSSSSRKYPFTSPALCDRDRSVTATCLASTTSHTTACCTSEGPYAEAAGSSSQRGPSTAVYAACVFPCSTTTAYGTVPTHTSLPVIVYIQYMSTHPLLLRIL